MLANCEKVQPQNVNTALIIKRLLNLHTKTLATWNICRAMHYLGANFHLGLSELSTRSDVLLSTTKVDNSLFE